MHTSKINFPFTLVFILALLPPWIRPGASQPIVATSWLSYTSSQKAAPGALLPEAEGCGGDTVPAVNADFEQQVVELVNAARAENNLPPLKKVLALEQAARYHAADMSEDDYFDHDTFDRQAGELVFVCGTWDRIASYYSGGRAENIAAGYSTPEEVMAGWIASPAHKANIFSAGSWEIGVGYFEGSGSYNQYWVQNFGQSSGVYPLIINGEAATTAERSVSLYLYGDWEEMRLRNEEGAWSDWEPFQATPAWTLSSGAGVHTVTAELRSGSQTVTTSDTIYLTGEEDAPVLGNLPDAIHFTYSIPSQRMTPAFYTLTPALASGSGPLTWSLSTQATFFTAMPQQGTTPDPLTVMPTFFDHGNPGSYNGTITITVIEPGNVQGSPHVVEVTLQVINFELHEVFLPGIQN